MDLEDLEDEEPNVELKIEEPNEGPESAEANISSGTITLEKPSTPSLIDISQESPQDQPIKGEYYIFRIAVKIESKSRKTRFTSPRAFKRKNQFAFRGKYSRNRKIGSTSC